MPVPHREAARHQPPVSWLERINTLTIGAAGGITVNQLSDDFGYHGASFALSTSSILAATIWLRRLPARAPLIRYIQTALLSLAAASAMLATFAPTTVARPASLISAAAVLIGVLLTASLFQASRILLGAAIAGLTAGSLQVTVISFANRDWLTAGHSAAMGVASFYAFMAITFDSDQLRRTAFPLTSSISATLIVIFLLRDQTLAAIFVAAPIFVATHFRRQLPIKGVVYHSVAPGILATGSSIVPGEAPPEWLRRKIDGAVGRILAATFFGLVFGVLSIHARQELLGVAFVLGSMGCLVRGVHLLRYGLFIEKLRRRWYILVSDTE